MGSRRMTLAWQAALLLVFWLLQGATGLHMMVFRRKFLHPSYNPRTYICTLMKNEAPLVREWVAFHLLQVIG